MTCLGMAFLCISCAWVLWSVWDPWVFMFEKFLAIISSKLFLPPHLLSFRDFYTHVLCLKVVQ